MKGTRPLDNNEIRLVSACFTGTFEARNRGLFILGVSTGGRTSELLSLTRADKYTHTHFFDKVIICRSSQGSFTYTKNSKQQDEHQQRDN